MGPSHSRFRWQTLDAENSEFALQFAAAQRRAEMATAALHSSSQRGPAGLTDEWQRSVDLYTEAKTEAEALRKELARVRARYDLRHPTIHHFT